MTKEEIKKLVERYPYLKPRNVWTGKVPEDYDYPYIRGIGEIPEGWNKLFLQMCEDIRQPLIDANRLEKFMFWEIKEKYNRLDCYCIDAPEEVREIINKYSVLASFVCTRCGKPAAYQTQGYIASYCQDCWNYFQEYWKNSPGHDKFDCVEFTPTIQVSRYDGGVRKKEVISLKKEWDKYLKGVRYD